MKKKREIFVCSGCNLFKDGVTYSNTLKRIDIFRCTLEGIMYNTKKVFCERQLPELCHRKLEHLVVTKKTKTKE